MNLYEGIKNKLNESYYDAKSEEIDESELTQEEKHDMELDEDGIDENFDKWIHCDWCEEVVPISECKKELNLGWICKDCQNALSSRGEHAVYDDNAEYINEED